MPVRYEVADEGRAFARPPSFAPTAPAPALEPPTSNNHASRREASRSKVQGRAPRELPRHLARSAVVIGVKVRVRAVPRPTDVRLVVTGPDLLPSGLPRLGDTVLPPLVECVAVGVRPDRSGRRHGLGGRSEQRRREQRCYEDRDDALLHTTASPSSRPLPTSVLGAPRAVKREESRPRLARCEVTRRASRTGLGPKFRPPAPSEGPIRPQAGPRRPNPAFPAPSQSGMHMLDRQGPCLRPGSPYR